MGFGSGSGSGYGSAQERGKVGGSWKVKKKCAGFGFLLHFYILCCCCVGPVMKSEGIVLCCVGLYCIVCETRAEQ